MVKEKILIVEDNKALSKLIAKRIESSLHFHVDTAFSLAETKRFMEQENDYFLALLDLNLPDAPDGEVVDFVLEHNIPTIVLTGTIDEATRTAILKKEIIDYVYKGNIDDVNYIFSLIERLYKNQSIKVLIVDDSITVRAQIKSLLRHQMFNVLVAAHGEEALVFLDHHPDIKLVLTDYQMPVIDGVELTKEIRKRYTKNELSIIAMTASDKEHISAKFLKIGANDFINKPFSKEEIACRINNSLDALEYITRIKDMAENDFMTGISNRRYFFDAMKQYMKHAKQTNETFAIAMIDIDNFKKINDTWGHDVGDLVIKQLARIAKESSKGSDIVARFGGEEFCIVLKNIGCKEALEFFIKFRNTIASVPVSIDAKQKLSFTVSVGVAFSDFDTVEEILKQSDNALYVAKANGKNRVEVA